jgi:hypothetical protein
MPRELPQFYMSKCSHGNILFLRNEKEERGNKRRVVYRRGRRFLYSCVLLRFRNALKLTPSSAPHSLGRTNSYKNLRYK